MSPDTVKRDWQFAKLWLLRELRGERETNMTPTARAGSSGSAMRRWRSTRPREEFVADAGDAELGRDVAITILPRLFVADPERLARFEREARMLASLNHPHIGAIYGLEDVDGISDLVLRLPRRTSSSFKTGSTN